MKQGWQIKKLGSLCSFERGLTYSKGDEAAFSNKGVFRSNNVDLASNTLNFDEIKYLKEEIEIPVSKKVKRNSLLMCMSNGSKAHLGKVAIIEDDLDFAFGGFMGLLVPDEAIVFPRYFYYALITPIYKSFIKGLSDGANINNLKFADLKEFEIPIPSISEQQRIVSLLDAEFAKIDTLKANAERNMQNAKDLFQAALKKELEPKEGWKKTTLQDICTNIVDCPHTTPVKSSTKTDYPCIRTSELRNGEIYWETMQYVDESEYRKRVLRLVPQENDIVYGREGTFGDAVLLPKRFHFCLGQRTMLFRPNQELVIPKFLLLYVISPYVYDQAKAKNTGCGVAHVNVRDIKDFKINLPQTHIQQSIVARLDAMNEKCKTLQANYEKTIGLCDGLKQALLRKAFNGDI